MSIHSYLPDDEYKPLVSKPSLQQYDNYQYYSLICCDYPGNFRVIDRMMVTGDRDLSTNDSLGGINTKVLKTFADYETTTTGEAGRLIAYQQFSLSPIAVNFSSIASKANVQPPVYRKYRYQVSTTILASFEDRLRPGSPIPADFQAACDSQPGLNNFIYDNYAYIEATNIITFGSSGSGTQGQQFYYRNHRLIQIIYAGADTTVQRLDMFSLLGGYSGDPRVAPTNYPKITPTKTGTLRISYYRRNPYEPIKNVDSLDWHTYTIDLVEGKTVHLPLINPVFGTLMFEGKADLVADVKSLLSPTGVNRYSWSDYYLENIDATINGWKDIQNSFLIPPPLPPGTIIVSLNEMSYLAPIQRVVSANNNHWDNDANNYPDFNFIPNHPLFLVNEVRAYNWHIKPQSDGSYGDLMMNSPKLEEVHAALDAGKYALNSLDSSKPRVTNIGHLIEKAAFLLGYRPDDNGKVDRVKERDEIVRKQIDKRDPSVAKSIRDGEYSPACFAEKGMVLKRLPNEVRNGRIVEGQVEKVHDIPQVLASILDQLNESLGIQEGSNIQLPLSNKGKAIYSNQLALLLDMARTLAEINEYTRSTRITAMITHQQVGEILAATGLEPIAKFIEVSSDGKTTAQIPYWGIHPKESLRTSIDNVTANVGILLGQIGV